MRKIFSIVFLLSIFSSCHLNGSSDKYSIQGTLKNHPAKSVLLEKLTLQKIVAVDSAKVDDKGGFKMEGITEKGFYRLKLDEKTFFLVLLEPAKYTVNIDLANQLDPCKIVGPADNDEFQTAMKKIGETQRELGNWRMTYQMLAQKGTSQDTLAFVQQQMQMAAMKMEQLVKDSSKVAKSPLVAMFYVTNVQIDQFPKENLAVLQRMEKEMPGSTYTKDYRDVYTKYEAQMKSQEGAKQAAESIAVGKAAPDIDLKDPNGKSIKLSSLKGKVVLLDFWASWCGPCRMEMPNVVAAYKKYKDKGFTVYSVSLDKDAAAWKNAITALGMVWENQVSDLKWWQSEAAVRYGIQGIPAAYLLDKNGIIVASNLRGEALDQKIAEVIK
ncbi:MAG: alkyl hydroperoxide reductase [Bacteroidota bacterium]|nr:alkyl hydroperoxide reductase [Bacteroidota bacterium]